MTLSNEHGPGIVVCLKWVAIRPEIDPLTATVSADDRFSGISPADSAALEWSLRIAQGRPVTAVSVGPTAAVAGLRHALAHGVQAAIHIETEEQDLPSRTVADALATVCTEADIVLCGDHSLDRGSGAVPAFLAARLGAGQALGCVGLELGDAQIVAVRRLDQGRRERLRIDGPTVLSFEGGLELRRASLTATIDAAEKPITVAPLAGLALDRSAATGDPSVVGTKPYRPRPRVLPAPVGSTIERVRQLTGVGEEQPASQQIELPPEEAAKAVVDQLEAWGYLDVDEDTNPSSDGPAA